jgi:predicted nucleotidyltransferase
MVAAPLQKLEKVLALADSDQDGEALAALRAARSMLQQSGIELSEVLTAALSDDAARKGGKKIFGSLELMRLRQMVEIRQLEAEAWKREAEAAKQALTKSEQERERWHRLANETMEKLWQIAQTINAIDDK